MSAVWGILNGMWSIVVGLNAAYEVEETRPWWKVLFIASGLTVCLSILGLTALAAMHLGGQVAAQHSHTGLVAVRNVAKLAVVLTLLFISSANSIGLRLT